MLVAGFRLTGTAIGARLQSARPFDFMNPPEPSMEVQSPSERAGILAALTCLACLTGLVWWGKPMIESLRVWWAGWLIYTLLPTSLTFAVLYASCFHRELKKAVRARLLFLISWLIFAGVSLVLLAMAFILLADLPLSRFHY